MRANVLRRSNGSPAAHGGNILSLCAALKSACEHRNPQQRATTGHVKRALVWSAEPQVLAAPRDAPEGDYAYVLSGGAQNFDPRFRQRIKPAFVIGDQAIG